MRKIYLFWVLTISFIFLLSGMAYANTAPRIRVETGWLFQYSIPLALLSILIVNPGINRLNFLIFIFISLRNPLYRVSSLLYIVILLYISWFILAWKSFKNGEKTPFHIGFIPALLVWFYLRHNYISADSVTILLLLLIVVFCIISPFENNILEYLEDNKKKITFQDDKKEPEKPWSKPAFSFSGTGKVVAVILGLCFITACFTTISSEKASVLYYKRKAIMMEILQMVHFMDDHCKDKANLPSSKEFIKLRDEYLSGRKFRNPEFNCIKYKLSNDRKSYTLYYDGDTFQKSRWFLLPSGYPRYDSAKGMDLGEREPFF